MYWRVVESAYAVRYWLPRLLCRVVRRATVIRELSASLTAFSEGNALATSGVSKTRFVPRRYSFRYFLRTPMPNEVREYSARSSPPLPFRINHLFFSGHHTCTDDTRPSTSIGTERNLLFHRAGVAMVSKLTSGMSVPKGTKFTFSKPMTWPLRSFMRMTSLPVSSHRCS